MGLPVRILLCGAWRIRALERASNAAAPGHLVRGQKISQWGPQNSITLTIMHNVVMKRCYAFGGAQMAKQIIVDQVDSMETTLAHLFPEMTANITVAF